MKHQPPKPLTPFRYCERQRTPPNYECGVCGLSGVRLYRDYQTTLDAQTLRCRAHALEYAGPGEEFSNPREHNIGFLVSAIPTEDGSTYWGYTSVPQAGVEWWEALPKVAVLKEMVVGFLFTQQAAVTSVVLILKNRPAWQAGLLNGVGGKVEPGEDPWRAMEREFREETGLTVDWCFWRRFTTLWEGDHVVHFFTATVPQDQSIRVTSLTDEPVEWLDMHRVLLLDRMQRNEGKPKLLIDNLRWLLPLALDHDSRVDAFTA